MYLLSKAIFFLLNLIFAITSNGQNLGNFFTSEFIQYSTVKIDAIKGDSIRGSGTAFFFEFIIDSTSRVPIIVTNKHVVDTFDMAQIYPTIFDKIKKEQKIEPFLIKRKEWIMHPDPSVDLAIITIGPFLNMLQKKQIDLLFYPISEMEIPNDEALNNLKGVEDVLMIGYPIGIWDSTNNRPVIRKGITATNPKYDYLGRDEFLIDAACFPGSSGSPVLILEEGIYSTKANLMVGTNFIFLGILYGGPEYSPNGEIKVINIQIDKKEIKKGFIPINLGYVISSNKILDFKKIIGIE